MTKKETGDVEERKHRIAVRNEENEDEYESNYSDDDYGIDDEA